MEDPKKNTEVYFISAKYEQRTHKFIKFVTGTCVADVHLKVIIPLHIRGSPPVLDDAGVSLGGTDKLPPRVRILLEDETYELLERSGLFFDSADSADSAGTLIAPTI